MKWRIGEVTITKIVELEVTGAAVSSCRRRHPRRYCRIACACQPDFAMSVAASRMSIHALVVETPSRRIIVDTCLGMTKGPADRPEHLQTSFLADLAAAGYARETIDTVICTHLHVDHVGWNTMLVDGSWVRPFRMHAT